MNEETVTALWYMAQGMLHTIDANGHDSKDAEDLRDRLLTVIWKLDDALTTFGREL